VKRICVGENKRIGGETIRRIVEQTGDLRQAANMAQLMCAPGSGAPSPDAPDRGPPGDIFDQAREILTCSDRERAEKIIESNPFMMEAMLHENLRPPNIGAMSDLMDAFCESDVMRYAWGYSGSILALAAAPRSKASSSAPAPFVAFPQLSKPLTRRDAYLRLGPDRFGHLQVLIGILGSKDTPHVRGHIADLLRSASIAEEDVRHLCKKLKAEALESVVVLVAGPRVASGGGPGKGGAPRKRTRGT
jgi:hypothetical protein